MIFLVFYILFIDLFRHTACADDLGVEFSGSFYGAFLGLEVHMHQAKPGALSFNPFEVVAKAPVVIPQDRQSGFAERLQVLVYVAAAQCVVFIAGAVFRYVYREFYLAIEFFYASYYALRIDLPAQVVFRRAFEHAVLESRNSGTCIIVHRNKITEFAALRLQRSF